MRTVCDLLGLALFTMFAVWVALILLVTPDRKPVVTCAPLHYSVAVGQRVVSAGVGTDFPARSAATAGDFADRATLACLAYVDRYMGVNHRTTAR